MFNLHLENTMHMDYWFKQPDQMMGPIMWFLVVILLALILSGFILKLARRYRGDKFHKEIMRRVSNLNLTVGILGLLWLFMLTEHVLLLAWRFWVLVLSLIFFWWLSRVLRYATKRVPFLRAESAAKENLEKYLPGRN
mgnify:CR=1 FL=1